LNQKASVHTVNAGWYFAYDFCRAAANLPMSQSLRVEQNDVLKSLLFWFYFNGSSSAISFGCISNELKEETSRRFSGRNDGFLRQPSGRFQLK
jgi:hypothetical protein